MLIVFKAHSSKNVTVHPKETWQPPHIIFKLVPAYLSPVKQQLRVHWTRFALNLHVTTILTACRKHSWGDTWLRYSQRKRNLVDEIFQTHRCCWILVSQHKVWAHGTELFIFSTKPVCLCPTRPWHAVICSVWCCHRFPETRAELLQTWATLDSS